MTDPSSWDATLDAVIAAPKHHKVLYENPSIIIGGRPFLCSIRFRVRFMIFLQTVRSCLQTGMS
jgi:hypothetical protein